MSEEHAFNATKSVASELAAYVMAVAQKHGQQEAFELLSSAFDQFGRRVGSMIKEQLGGKELNIQNISGIVVSILVEQGFEPETIEKTEDSVTFRIPRCPLYEGCEEAGAPAGEICKYMAEPLMNGILKAIKPKAQHKVIKYRTSAEDHCIEQVIIE